MAPTAKPKILDIAPYVGGGTKAASDKPTIKLSSNEAAFGASPKALKALQSIELHRYPNAGSSPLRNALAEHYAIAKERIVCGAGSDEIISLLCLAFAGHGDEVLYSQYGFLMYAISSMAVGATPVKAPETNYRTDIESILHAVTDKTKIIFIANPNNPTGSYITKQDMQSLCDRCPKDILIVFDCAYAEYVSEEDYCDGIALVEQYDNVVMTRTFSKIYGLASLRLGWAYCPDAIADILNRVRGPFNVSTPAHLAGIAALQDTAFIEKARIHNDEQLAWLQSQFNTLGYKSYPSVCNFILVEFDNANAVNEHLLSQGIIARAVANYGLPNCLRFTIGTEAENKAVIDALTAMQESL